MCALEVVAAIVAETLIEIGVLIFIEPPEIHWSNNLVTKLPAGTRTKKKGKTSQKHKHGIYGELVASLAPSIPPQTDTAAISVAKKGSKSRKFKTPIKPMASGTTISEQTENKAQSEGADGGASDAVVDGLH